MELTGQKGTGYQHWMRENEHLSISETYYLQSDCLKLQYAEILIYAFMSIESGVIWAFSLKLIVETKADGSNLFFLIQCGWIKLNCTDAKYSTMCLKHYPNLVRK